MLDSDLSDDIEGAFFSILSVLAPLIAAGMAIYGVLFQVQKQDDREVARLASEAEKAARELDAERAALPLALTRICEIAVEGMQGMLNDNGNLSRPRKNCSIVLEQTYVESIKASIKVAPSLEADVLKALIRVYQPAKAQHDDLSHQLGHVARKGTQQTSHGVNRISNLLRWAVLYALAASLFNFSRGKESHISAFLSDNPIDRSVQIAGIYPSLYISLEEMLASKNSAFINTEISEL